ncbi:hypothetical protein PIB30_021740 [Stylosanthes scabra]|uniref:Uncharacterized protein n=1 Tax=Stylosanthes scabra TaxID=79078 RepID=A0ABU6T8N0_9FABA|nr:hypothetical protein [Stylosanthes scabra]
MQKNKRMPVSYACQRGAGRPRRGGRADRGRGEGGDAAPTQQTQGGASTSRAVEEAETSSQAYLSPTRIRAVDERHDMRGRQCLQAGHAVRWLSDSSGPKRAYVRSVASFYGSWWDSSIRITCAGCLMGRTVYGACASADSSSVTCIG